MIWRVIGPLDVVTNGVESITLAVEVPGGVLVKVVLCSGGVPFNSSLVLVPGAVIELRNGQCRLSEKKGPEPEYYGN